MFSWPAACKHQSNGCYRNIHTEVSTWDSRRCEPSRVSSASKCKEQDILCTQNKLAFQQTTLIHRGALNVSYVTVGRSVAGRDSVPSSGSVWWGWWMWPMSCQTRSKLLIQHPPPATAAAVPGPGWKRSVATLKFDWHARTAAKMKCSQKSFEAPKDSMQFMFILNWMWQAV